MPAMALLQASAEPLNQHRITLIKRRGLLHSFSAAQRIRSPESLRASSPSKFAEIGIRVQILLQRDRIIARTRKSASSESLPITEEADYASEELEPQKQSSNTSSNMLIFKLLIALGVAAAATVLSMYLRRSTLYAPHCNLSLEAPVSSLALGSSVTPQSSAGFSFSLFGYKIFLPQYPPGWLYFWLLMAAACGLCISEEALNVWVGASLARLLTFDSWKTFMSTLSGNASYIVSTVLWVYWGVCISDMIPFYLGRFAGRSKAADVVFDKVGIKKEKIEEISASVQLYGNLIGFVERFSIGIRNPTAFLAGAAGISPECFFLGVCLGGLITLPIQMGIGYLLRERPMAALAGVATVVGIWTVFPYVAATVASLIYFIRRRSA